MVYDVVVIGAGVVGAFVARAISEYDLKTCVVDKGSDVAMGASKANSAIIHAGFDPEPGTFKARFNLQGNEMMETMCTELDVPFKRIGSIVMAFQKDGLRSLEQLQERGIKNGVKGLKIINREEIIRVDGNVSSDVEMALFAPSAGIVCPYELTLAAMENAVDNGVELKLETEVKSIDFKDELFMLNTNKEILCCRVVINAAGIYSDAVAQMIGDQSFTITPRKGEYILLDKSQGTLVKTVLFQLPTKQGKGILVTPTVDGNLLIGPNASTQDDKEDVSTSTSGLEQVMKEALRSVPIINMRETVSSFAGLRATPSTGDFIIGPSMTNNKFINVAGIESPGLTAAPAIGKYVAGLLKDTGLVLKENSSFNPLRRPVTRFRELHPAEINELIRKEPLYGKIVCRCEKVTEGEVVDCIKRSVGAMNLDGVKRRTRAGMGRCQGGFCSPLITGILARELGISMDEVTKKGYGSKLLVGRTK